MRSAVMAESEQARADISSDMPASQSTTRKNFWSVQFTALLLPRPLQIRLDFG